MSGQTEQDRRPYVHDLHVAREAVDVISACNGRVNDIGKHYGYDSKRYREAEQTWRRNLSMVFNMGFGADTRVTRDGELSLFISTSTGFVYGLIFHEEHRHCLREGCKAQINDDGKAWVYMPDYHMCDDHQPSYPLDAPHPGSWSFHS